MVMMGDWEMKGDGGMSLYWRWRAHEELGSEE